LKRRLRRNKSRQRFEVDYQDLKLRGGTSCPLSFSIHFSKKIIQSKFRLQAIYFVISALHYIRYDQRSETHILSTSGVKIFLDSYPNCVGKIHGNGKSDFEDLAFPIRPSREADGIGRRVCLSTVGTIGWNDLRHGHLGRSEKPVARSYAGAEMDDEGMALKI